MAATRITNREQRAAPPPVPMAPKPLLLDPQVATATTKGPRPLPPVRSSSSFQQEVVTKPRPLIPEVPVKPRPFQPETPTKSDLLKLDVPIKPRPLVPELSVKPLPLEQQEVPAKSRPFQQEVPAKPRPLEQPEVTLRVKTTTSADRLSQSKSLIEPVAISRHRRNKSLHVPVGKPSESLQTLTGALLYVTRVSDGGKKQKKSWTLMWIVLTSDQLLFYKDRQENNQMFAVQLSGAAVGWTNEKSKRKNVFQIKCSSGSEFLLQSETLSTAEKMFEAIRTSMDSKTHIQRSNSSDVLAARSSASPVAKQRGHRDSAHRRSIKVFRLTHSSSDSDRLGVKSRLKKFISRRPSMRSLQEKGIIRDRVFGCHLSILCEREKNNVPKFVHMCLENVEKRGLDVDGIYRVSGNLATIQKLRFIVDQEEPLDLSQFEDIHVVSGALKMFFRELPEPLFPFKAFDRLTEASQIKDTSEKIEAMKKLIREFPKPNYETMKLLFTHLHRVLEYSKVNRMSSQSLGIVFGPTLLWPQLESGNKMAENMIYQNQTVEFILMQSDRLFD